jgi:hypothetical protein
MTNLMKDRESGEWQWRVNVSAINANIEGMRAFDPEADAITHNRPIPTPYTRSTLFVRGKKSGYIRPTDTTHREAIMRWFPN